MWYVKCAPELSWVTESIHSRTRSRGVKISIVEGVFGLERVQNLNRRNINTQQSRHNLFEIQYISKENLRSIEIVCFVVTTIIIILMLIKLVKEDIFCFLQLLIITKFFIYVSKVIINSMLITHQRLNKKIIIIKPILNSEDISKGLLAISGFFKMKIETLTTY